MHRRGRGAELRGGGLVAVQRDVRHPELVPHGGPVLGQVAADHRDLPAAHALPHQAADGTGGGAGFLLPAGGGKQPHLPRLHVRGALPPGQQLFHRRKAGGIPVAQIPPQQLRGGHFGSVFPGQLPQLGGHLLGPGEQAHIAGQQRGPIITQGHRHAGQRGQQRGQQPLFGGIERIEFVDEHGPPIQEFGHSAPRKGRFQPCSGQFQPVGGVHAAAGQQALVALKDQCQLAQLAAFSPAALGQKTELLPGKSGAFQLVDGLGGHLAECRAAAVAVIVVYVVLQLLQCAAHQHGAACVGKSLHRRTALHREDALGQAGERKALHPAGKRIPQFPVDAPLGGGGELLRHQQDAFLPRLCAGLDAGIQQRGFPTAGAA